MGGNAAYKSISAGDFFGCCGNKASAPGITRTNLDAEENPDRHPTDATYAFQIYGRLLSGPNSVLDGIPKTCIYNSKYVAEPVLRFELAAPSTVHEVYVTAAVSRYAGTLNYASAVVLGRSQTWPCARWDTVVSPFADADFPDGSMAHNYCRNPDKSVGGSWCYTVGGPERAFCDLDGFVDVRLAPSPLTRWEDARGGCTQHRTGFEGPAGLQIDPLTNQAVFECNVTAQLSDAPGSCVAPSTVTDTLCADASADQQTCDGAVAQACAAITLSGDVENDRAACDAVGGTPDNCVYVPAGTSITSERQAQWGWRGDNLWQGGQGAPAKCMATGGTIAPVRCRWMPAGTTTTVLVGTTDTAAVLCLSADCKEYGATTIVSDVGRPLNLCEVGVFGASDVDEFAPIHGAFFYNPRGERTPGESTPYFWDFEKSDQGLPGATVTPSNPATAAAFSMVVAGNSTVRLRTHRCPRAGCPDYAYMIEEEDNAKYFLWSNDTEWNRTGVPADDVPSTMRNTEIPLGWTVVLDCETVVMRLLTIRGSLLVLTEHAADAPVALHAHIIDIRGGELSIGNATDPFLGLHASIILHGDAYVWGGHKDNKCYSTINPEAVQFSECAKILNVRGTFQAYGRPRDTIRRFGADAAKGDSAIVVAEPVDWEAGDSLVLTGTSGKPFQMNIWKRGFPHGDGRQVQANKEIVTVASVSVDRRTVTLTAPLANNHVGQIVDQVRKTPSWPRSWANYSPVQLYSHRNAWANLHLFGPT